MPTQIYYNPNSPNAAYNRLIYQVSGSTNSTQPQFKYVMDVYSVNQGEKTLLKRSTQTLNPERVAVFNPANIIQGDLDPDIVFKITQPTPFSSSVQEYSVEFGEQYGTSVSSSITVYSSSVSHSLECFLSVVEPNDGSNQWSGLNADTNVLSNMPATMSMEREDYGTVGLYSGSNAVSASYYSGSTLLHQDTYDVGSPASGSFNTIPLGQNTNDTDWHYLTLTVTNSAFTTKSYRYERIDNNNREKVRFSFLNKQGSWDYVNIYNPVRIQSSIERNSFTYPFVNYSVEDPVYDITRRGKYDYNIEQDTLLTIDTDYLDQTNATWLEELLESPSVFIQKKDLFIPINITNTQYVANTDEFRQRLFKYTITFRPSNEPYGTWIADYPKCIT